MGKREDIRSKLTHLGERSRLRLSAAEAELLLSGLGVLAGLLAGLVILAFRSLVEGVQGAMLPGHGENYEGLPPLARLLLPIAGALLIALYLRFVARKASVTGVPHVMNRVAYHQGYLPWQNAVTQFVCGALAIISGQPVGREGPSVHLGAASASQLGQKLGLPNNSMRILVASGTAAAIAASFNTPLAGVAFAMEVVVMDYSIAGFLPVILAAVTATVLVQLVYGASPAFHVPPLDPIGLIDLPQVIVAGVLMGVLAAAFIRLMKLCIRLGRRNGPSLRLLAAGLIAGLAGLLLPQVMAIGYDTVSATIAGQLGWALLLGLTAAKLLSTAFVLGMGVPAGLIGPTIFIGAVAGGALGHAAGWAAPEAAASPTLYALIGMGAMMGATLRAPLAALTALLELTGNPTIIFPGMLAVAAATLTASELFKEDSIFFMQLRAQGLETRRTALLQGFDRVGVARVMDRRLAVLPRRLARARLHAALAESPRWILIEEAEKVFLIPVTDVLNFLEREADVEDVDLLEVPAQRLQAAPIELRATLREALLALRRESAEALCVVQTNAPGLRRYYGVVMRQDIDSQYLLSSSRSESPARPLDD